MSAITEFNELISSYDDDVFSSFPSSPEQVCLFSTADDDEADYEYFQELPSPSLSTSAQLIKHLNCVTNNHVVNQVNAANNNSSAAASLKRKSHDDDGNSVPELPRKKIAMIEQETQLPLPLWTNDFTDSGLNSPQAPSSPAFQSFHKFKKGFSSSSTTPSLVITPSSITPSSITPSRIKSTTPNIQLLFSLFDVLNEPELRDDDDDDASSPCGSPSASSSRSSSPSDIYSSPPSSPDSFPHLEDQIVFINTNGEPISSPAHCVPELETGFGNNMANSFNYPYQSLPWIAAGQY
jgi:hypothetical protein